MVKEAVEEKTELSKEQIQLEKKKKNNIRIYPIYRVFSWDILFYFAIIYLFLTTQKDLTPAQVLQIDAFYLVFKLVLQIPCTLFIQKVGKRKSLIIANAVGAIHVLIIMFASSFLGLVISQLLCAFTFIIRGTCDTDMLYDSLEHNEKRGHTFAKIDGKAMARYYYIDAITAILSGFLFVVNPYIPLVLCFVTFLITFFLTTMFEEIHPEKGKMHIQEEMKNIRYGFKNIMKSRRLKSLLMYDALYVGLVVIMRNLRNVILVEIGVEEQYFGIIFAVMGISLAIATRLQGRIHNKFRNKTLTFLALPNTLACLAMGFIMLSNFSMLAKITITLILLVIQSSMKGPFFVLIKRYFNNFTDSTKRVKIATAQNLCENIIAALLTFVAAFVLENLSIQFTTIIVGCVFTIVFTLLLDHMRKVVGLKPEEYDKREIL